MPEDSEAENDELLLLGTIHIDVFIDTNTGELVPSTTVEDIEMYQAVGILEQAKLDQLYFSREEDEE